MPRFVRNSWVETYADGYSTTDTRGPRLAGGGMTSRWFVRRNGLVTPALTIHQDLATDSNTGEELVTLAVYTPKGLTDNNDVGFMYSQASKWSEPDWHQFQMTFPRDRREWDTKAYERT